MVKLKSLKGKFPEKMKTVFDGDELETACYNSGQESYAELEIEVDVEKLKKFLWQIKEDKNIKHGEIVTVKYAAEQIASNLGEIIRIGGE